MEQINIQKVSWKNEYSVNNEQIDEQHKKLFEMLNILIENKEVNIHSSFQERCFRLHPLINPVINNI